MRPDLNGVTVMILRGQTSARAPQPMREAQGSPRGRVMRGDFFGFVFLFAQENEKKKAVLDCIIT
jgi:hypothetical protein